MNQSWKINASIEIILMKDKASAISQLGQIKFIDIATELYDLYKNFQDIQKQNTKLSQAIIKLSSAITNLLSLFGKKQQSDEFEKDCLNDLKMIQSIINRVTVDITQSEDKSNNQSNSQQNQIYELQKKIEFQEDQIQQLIKNSSKLSNLNNLLLQQNYEQINNFNQLHQKQTEQNQKTSFILFKNELEQLNKKIQDATNKFEQIKSQSSLLQNMENQSRNLNVILKDIPKIQENLNIMNITLQKYIDEIKLNLEKLNKEEIIQNLLKTINNNRLGFQYFQSILGQFLLIIQNIFKENKIENEKI
ncbi:unnamed protein product [Paramecium pentaurelia]|uniref:Kinase domain protein n=1 Tax=Paramecium pentaurelia TaxID=43138 RepID=A0A8S1UKA0_9CILI|nr:unnamed protein product [Paramecium pentaurelia]